MKIILIIFIWMYGFADDYSGLKQKKELHHLEKSNSLNSVQSFSSESSNTMILRFKDINSFDFSKFEESYNVKFLYCIAHGICFFENESTDNINLLIDKIRLEMTNIKSIKEYKKYKMRVF